MLIFGVWYYKVMIAFTYCWSRDPRKTHSSWCPGVPLKGKEEEHTWCELPSGKTGKKALLVACRVSQVCYLSR